MLLFILLYLVLNCNVRLQYSYYSTLYNVEYDVLCRYLSSLYSNAVAKHNMCNLLSCVK